MVRQSRVVYLVTDGNVWRILGRDGVFGGKRSFEFNSIFQGCGIEKRREHSKIAEVGKRNSKTLYQKDKESRRMEKTPKNEKSHVMTCFNCGKDRHPHSKLGGWKINCPAAKATS